VQNKSIDNQIVDPSTYSGDMAHHDLFAFLRREDPVHWTEPDGFRPFWTITKHADVVEVERQAEVFENGPRLVAMASVEEDKIRAVTGGRNSLQRTMLSMNGAEHTANRGVAREWFLPRNIVKLQEQVAEIAESFVGRLDELGGVCDFAGSIGVWYPLRVIMLIFGLPPEAEPLLHRLSREISGSQDPVLRRANTTQAEHMMQVTAEFFEYFKTIVADRRAHPRDDLASVIANAKVDGAPLDDNLVHSYYLNICVAGHDSTSSALNGGLLALIDHPQELAKLRANPQLMPKAVDEVLRWTVPLKHFFRNATRDYDLRGKKIRRGDTLLMSYPSACRDEEVFGDPFNFRIDRNPNAHLTFAHGPHSCLGQVLARQELNIFYTKLLQRVHGIERAGEPTYVQSLTFVGLQSLPIRYRMHRNGPGAAA
jgi:cytochrome P450